MESRTWVTSVLIPRQVPGIVLAACETEAGAPWYGVYSARPGLTRCVSTSSACHTVLAHGKQGLKISRAAQQRWLHFTRGGRGRR